ncbi:hypothetical protein MTR67_049437 [Solanum verrucosum]|uniref:Kiwellin n=1 Tax=Solanum verrucosum TaxID=315347 RepID=A0AAF0V0X0_SOLVR|nr:hypothetical protein MTR67_049437 [Solanum verrucosum]
MLERFTTKYSHGNPPSVPSPTPTNTCRPSGTINCNGVHPIYRCSPPVSSSTPAQLTFNDFSEGGDGGGPSSCDGKYHNNKERIVALSTGWFAGRSRCGKMILIRANNGKTVTAKVVDECDSTMGCDAEHAFQSPCKNNIVDGSIAVWRALGSSPPSVPSPTPTNTCRPSGTLNCNGVHPIYRCSPPVTSSTPAQLTLNDFSEGGDGGGPSSCDGKYHNNNERVVALSTGWFAGRSRCGKMILIHANNGKNVTAKVVDECDSTMGCDAEHAFQSPCKNNIVDGSIAVWRALGLNTNLGIVPVTWSMV